MRILPPNTQTSPTHSDGDSSGQQSPSHHDAVTQQALNALVSSSEQSYGQFLQGFSQLTTADIVPAVIHEALGTRSENPRGPPRYVDLIRDPEEPPSLKVPVQPLGSSLPPTATTREAPVVDEILYLNSLQTSNFTNLQEPPPKRVLRLDNFVEDGSNIFMDENAGSGLGLELEIENIGSGYAASFLVTSSERLRPEAEWLPQLGSVNDASCNSSPTTKVHFNTNLKQPTPQAKIGNGDELVYDPGLDLPNPGEVVDADREDPPGGQAQAAAMVTNVRKMAYSAREADSGKRSQHNYTDIEQFVHVHSDDEMDVVTPFTLDDEFDYDNVILTPKFTPEEQAELKEFSQSGNEEMVPVETPS